MWQKSFKFTYVNFNNSSVPFSHPEKGRMPEPVLKRSSSIQLTNPSQKLSKKNFQREFNIYIKRVSLILAKYKGYYGPQTYAVNHDLQSFVYSQTWKRRVILDIRKTAVILLRTKAWVRKRLMQPCRKYPTRKNIVFITTSPQHVDFIETTAKDCKAYFATQEWVAGTITNALVKLHHKVRRDPIPERSIFTKRKLPRFIIMTDIERDHKALETFQSLNIPVVAPVSLAVKPRHRGGILCIPTSSSTEALKFIIFQLAHEIKAWKARKQT
jgi:ribosomal protein S2